MSNAEDHSKDEITSLNIANLDVDELERRLELAITSPHLLDWCAVDICGCDGTLCGCDGTLCGADCPGLCIGDVCMIG